MGAFIYLAKRFFYRIVEFLRHWYVKSLRYYSNFSLNQFERLDRFFALKITLKNLFQPLYKDYSPIGYILGFGFRVSRVFAASVVYLLILLILVFLYLVWVFFPIFAVVKALGVS